MTSANVVRGAPAAVSGAASPTAAIVAPLARATAPRMAFRACLERAASANRSESAPVTPSVGHSGHRDRCDALVAASLPDASGDSDEVRRRHPRGLWDDTSANAFGRSPPPALPAPPAILRAPLETPGTSVRTTPSLEHLMTALVRRVAWSGDGRRGSARLEIGAGALAGGTLVIHADDGRVRVHLDAPAGVDVGAWRDRIARRLAERRIATDELEVT